MMKLIDILSSSGMNCVKSSIHSTPLEYRFASFPSEKLAPLSNTIYLCSAGKVPKNYSDFPSCCIMIINNTSTCAPETDGFLCEWCVIDNGHNITDIISRIQYVLSSSSKSEHIRMLKNKLTVGRLSLTAAVREACEIMGNPIAIFDDAYKVLAMESLGLPVDNDVWKAAKTRGSFTADNVKTFREAIGENDISSTPYLCATHAWEKTHCLVIQLITESGCLVGSMALYESFRPFEADDCDTMIQISRLFAALLASFRPEDAVYIKRITLLQELIDRVKLDDAELERKVVEYKLDSWSIYRLGYINLSDDPTLKRQSSFFHQILSAAVPDAVVFLRSRSLLVLFCAKEYNDITQMISKVESVLEGLSLSMGISGCFLTLNDIRSAYDSAKEALSLGQELMGMHPIYYSQQTFFFAILSTLSPKYTHNLYISNSYTRIDEYDKRFQTNYCASLVSYIQNMFSSTQAANELFIHKNSLLYRIGRVKSLFGVDVTNFLDVFEFWLGYQLSIYLTYQDAPDSSIPEEN